MYFYIHLQIYKKTVILLNFDIYTNFFYTLEAMKRKLGQGDLPSHTLKE